MYLAPKQEVAFNYDHSCPWFNHSLRNPDAQRLFRCFQTRINKNTAPALPFAVRK